MASVEARGSRVQHRGETFFSLPPENSGTAQLLRAEHQSQSNANNNESRMKVETFTYNWESTCRVGFRVVPGLLTPDALASILWVLPSPSGDLAGRLQPLGLLAE